MKTVEVIHLIQELKKLERIGASKKVRRRIFNQIPTEFKVTICLGCRKQYESSDCGCPAGSVQNLRDDDEISALLLQNTTKKSLAELEFEYEG